MERLPPADRAKRTRKPNPDAVLRQAEGALTMLSSEWKKTLDTFNKYESKIPPVMIVVCNNTDLAETVHQHIAKGNILVDLQNTDADEFTIRIDSKLLAEAESQLDIIARNSKLGKAEELREKVNTIGRIGEPGEQVRCVVSVSMLTEGWDAQNITQILGLRRFDSQLLCEQVVGRGLRRTNYDDLSEPECVDVYGVPFEVIPVKKASLTRPNPPQRLPTLVRTLPERKSLEIKFPRVEGYVYDIRRKVIANIEKIPVLYVSPANEPTEAIAKPATGVITERPSRLGPGEEKLETRDEFLKAHRLQTTIFEIASEVTRQLAPETRPFVFPQVLEITRQFVEKRVKVKPGATIDELALRRYSDPIISRLCDAIQPDVESGEAPLLPRIERHRERGSTSEVRFSTLKEAFATVKSHVSHVVTDSGWEHKIAYELDKPGNSVVAYVKNDHLDFVIPYEWEHEAHSYYPDFIVHLKLKDDSEVNVIVEVKGYEDEKDRAKKAAAQRWVAAVNHHGGFGRWDLRECKSQYMLPKVLENAKKQLEEKYCTEVVETTSN